MSFRCNETQIKFTFHTRNPSGGISQYFPPTIQSRSKTPLANQITHTKRCEEKAVSIDAEADFPRKLFSACGFRGPNFKQLIERGRGRRGWKLESALRILSIFQRKGFRRRRLATRKRGWNVKLSLCNEMIDAFSHAGSRVSGLRKWNWRFHLQSDCQVGSVARFVEVVVILRRNN